MTLVLLLLACARPPATAPPRGEAVYDVAVLAASGKRVISSVYSLGVQGDTPGVFVFTTLHSEGSWEEGAESVFFDSGVPRPSDPWPLVLQHAISTVPVALTFEKGAPKAMVDEAGWREAGLTAVNAEMQKRDLPDQARTTGEQLLDPGGVLRDLRRNFPGDPPSGIWSRAVSIAGVPARVTQVCEKAGARRAVCSGTAEGPTEGSTRLHEVDVVTEIVSDGQGLVSLEHTYSGTLVLYDPGQERVLDRPIAGKRLVQRR